MQDPLTLSQVGIAGAEPLAPGGHSSALQQPVPFMQPAGYAFAIPCDQYADVHATSTSCSWQQHAMHL